MHKTPRIYTCRWLPLGRDTDAITLPPLGIFVRSQYAEDSWLIAHELHHWKQARRLGVLRFYWRIVCEYLKYGHKNSPLEKEANKAADRALRRRVGWRHKRLG